MLEATLSVVDVNARDGQGRIFQSEIQLPILPGLPARIPWGRPGLYSARSASGEDGTERRPTDSPWLLGETPLPQAAGFAHRDRLRDEAGRSLIDRGGTALFHPVNFAVAAPHPAESEAERWLRYFVEGERLDPARLPEWIGTPAPTPGRDGRGTAGNGRYWGNPLTR